MKATIKTLAIVASAMCLTLLSGCENTSEVKQASSINSSPEAVIQGYSALCDEFCQEILGEYDQIRDTDIDLDAHFEAFAHSFEQTLTPEQGYYVNRVLAYSPTTRSAESVLPAAFIAELEAIVLDEDLSLLNSKIEQFYNSPDFSSLSIPDQEQAKIQLECLINVRNSVIELVTEIIDSNSLKTRMSPGDMRIWRDTIKQLTPDRRKVLGALALNCTIGGMGVIISPFWGYALGTLSSIPAIIGR